MFLFYPALSAILYIASFPFNFSGYVAFIALVPHFFLITSQSDIIKISASGTVFGLIISIYFSTPLYHSILINSRENTFSALPIIILTILIPNSIIFSILSLLIRNTYKISQYYRVFIPASIWILSDYLKEQSSVMLPWGLPGYTQVFTPFIQLADITGIHGISFIVILINSIIAEIISTIFYKSSAGYSAERNNFLFSTLIHQNRYKISLILILILSISATAYSHIRKKNIIESFNNAESIKYLIVQGNTESIDRWDESSSVARYQSYIQLTEKKIKEADFIVWPETVLNSSDKKNYEIMSAISSNINDTAFFITGAIRRDKKENIFNSIFILKNSGLEYIYDKNKLFPYSERPFFGYSAEAFFNSPAKFTEGNSYSIFRTGKILSGFSICFESIYPDIIRKQARSGANLLINVANDSWFGDSSVPHLQQYAVITRAIENRISIIRSSNSGISFGVSPSGDLKSVIPLNTKDISFNNLPIVSAGSFYTKNGNWIIIISIIIILSSIIYTEIRQIKN